jgi:hypothetical protein
MEPSPSWEATILSDIRMSQNFMEPDISLPVCQEPATSPYPYLCLGRLSLWETAVCILHSPHPQQQQTDALLLPQQVRGTAFVYEM